RFGVEALYHRPEFITVWEGTQYRVYNGGSSSRGSHHPGRRDVERWVSVESGGGKRLVCERPEQVSDVFNLFLTWDMQDLALDLTVPRCRNAVGLRGRGQGGQWAAEVRGEKRCADRQTRVIQPTVMRRCLGNPA